MRHRLFVLASTLGLTVFLPAFGGSLSAPPRSVQERHLALIGGTIYVSPTENPIPDGVVRRGWNERPPDPGFSDDRARRAIWRIETTRTDCRRSHRGSRRPQGRPFEERPAFAAVRYTIREGALIYRPND
jgi:hypothetical protein